MMNINWNKIIITALLIVFGISIYLYLILPGPSDIWFPSLTLHLMLSVLFTWNNYKKIYLLIMVILILINSILAFVEFPACDSNAKGQPITSCECTGITKGVFFGTQCIGKRSKCYKYGEGNSREELVRIYQPENKIEISCAELDRL